MHRVATGLCLVFIFTACSGASTATVQGKATFAGQSDSSGIIVSVGGVSAVTDSAGNYKLTLVKGQKYAVTATSGDSVEGVLTQAADTTASASVTLADFVLTPAGTVTGQVTVGSQVAGNAGTTVQVPGSKAPALTDDTGKFTLTGVPAGLQTIQALRAGYAVGLSAVTVPFKGSVTASPIALLAGGASTDFSGTVALYGNGSAQGTTISVDGVQVGTVAANGSFHISLPEGPHSLFFQKGAFELRVSNLLTFASGSFTLQSGTLTPMVSNFTLYAGHDLFPGRDSSLGWVRTADKAFFVAQEGSRVVAVPATGGDVFTVADAVVTYTLAADGTGIVTTHPNGILRFTTLADRKSVTLATDAYYSNGGPYGFPAYLGSDGHHLIYRTTDTVRIQALAGGSPVDVLTGLTGNTSVIITPSPKLNFAIVNVNGSSFKVVNLLTAASTSAISGSTQTVIFAPDEKHLIFFDVPGGHVLSALPLSSTGSMSSAPVVLTSSLLQLMNYPAFTPDGTRFLGQTYTDTSSSRSYTLYNFALDGSSSVPIGPVNESYVMNQCVASPNGQKVACYESIFGSEYVAPTSGVGQVVTFPNRFGGVWAGNDKLILYQFVGFASPFNTLLVPAAGGTESQLPSPVPASFYSSTPSPDGHRFYFLSYPYGAHDGVLQYVNLDSPSDPAVTMFPNVQSFGLSPDGARFCLRSAAGNISVAPVGGTPEPLTENSSVTPTWLDASTLTFIRAPVVTEPAYEYGLFVANLPSL